MNKKTTTPHLSKETNLFEKIDTGNEDDIPKNL